MNNREFCGVRTADPPAARVIHRIFALQKEPSAWPAPRNGPRRGPHVLRKNLKSEMLGALKILSAISALTALPGCVDHFGTGGTGELVVSSHQVNDVDSSQFYRYTSTQPAETQPATRPTAVAPIIYLSIEECRLAALHNNLDLNVTLYDPSIAHTVVTIEQAAFEATFNGAINYTQSRTPAAGTVGAFTQYNVQPDVNLQLPLQTGGFIRADAPYQFINDAGLSGPLNPTYTFNPNLTLNQPLLRGFGYDINAQSIRIAFYQYQQSLARTKLQVIRVLADTDIAYWHLYASRALLDVRRKQYDLAVAQLECARRQARAGMIAEVDIVRAESGVADQVEQIILADNDARQKERDLKRILQRPDLGIQTPTQVIPATSPSSVGFRLDPARLVAAALDQRMEMLDVELQIVADTANVRAARNQMLPLLSLQYTYGHTGYSGSASTTFNEVWNKNYDSHTVGLNLSIPIGNELAKSQLRQAMLSRLQQLASREQRVQQITQEVFNATDNLHTDWQRILAAHKRVELAQRVLGVEVRQFNQGLRTSTEVLDAQARLADAQSSEIAAITDYQISQVDIAVATGTVMGATRVHWDSAEIRQTTRDFEPRIADRKPPARKIQD